MNEAKIGTKMKLILSKREELHKILKYNEFQYNSNRFLYVFDYVLESLHGEYKNIITKSFIHNPFKYWWVNIYSKSSFYRLRCKALTSFVNLFEMIYENI